MFKFLKEKLKSAISKISEGVEKEGKVEEKIVEKPAEEPPKEESNASELPASLRAGSQTSRSETRSQVTGFFAKLKEKFTGKEEEKKEEEHVHPIKTEKKYEKPKITGSEEEIQEKTEAKEELTIAYKESEKKGFFATITEKITTTKIDNAQFEKLFWELEMALMENNVSVEVIEKIKNDLKEQLVEKPIKRTKVEETIQETLKNSVEKLFETSTIDLIEEIKNKKEKPYIIAFFGINGSGKTTSIAKLANMLKEEKISCVLAASDTFRAASIEQLQQHADKLGIKMIKHDYGSDPAAVAFDAIKHAKAKSIDVVLIDTAGRMHSNTNLIDEMKKIIRVAKPDLKIFVGESITGNDCVEQAKTFNEAVGIDGIILAKADIDEKGGAAVSVSYVTKKPILFLGTGQKYGDLQVFNSEVVMKSLGLA
ncbi:signal recognition particle-docking protein FtsY [Candidatus Woesearchaeota archaeon]|nr:signal recognition particle-docking protein FtsY [Candidatus Woesearchaeota archaeon]